MKKVKVAKESKLAPPFMAKKLGTSKQAKVVKVKKVK